MGVGKGREGKDQTHIWSRHCIFFLLVTYCLDGKVECLKFYLNRIPMPYADLSSHAIWLLTLCNVAHQN